MLEIPVLRWGKPYESMEQAEVVHFETAEPMAKIHQANGGILKMDMRKAGKAREILRDFTIDDLISKCEKAAALYTDATLPLGNGTQTPDDFCRIQSATTGLPEHMCRFNMTKNAFVLSKMGDVLDSLTRGIPRDILTRGYGKEPGRDVTVSWQATSPVLGAVLPNNSPGVHTLWLPVIPLQMGLVLKPGSQEPWTPYRVVNAFIEAGIPAEVFSLYPGPRDVGTALMEKCERSMIFGSAQTVEQYHGDPRVQAHGPGFSKILLGDDVCDDWEKYIDVIADSIFKNSGRSCISASGVWTPRHGREIAEALAERLGPVEPKPMTDPESSLAAFTTKGVAEAMNNQIDELLKQSGVEEVTAKYRNGDRWDSHERHDFLRPTIVYCSSSEPELANTEYMFPFASVVECPQDQMIKQIGTTLVCTAITDDAKWQDQLVNATNIDRLNLGPVPTLALNWLQPHEGNLIEFLFRARAVQTEAPAAH